MTEHHLITPPPGLGDQLAREWLSTDMSKPFPDWLANRAAQWGADQELEACIDWIAVYQGLEHPELLIELLRADRRPKPPSLKAQALAKTTALLDDPGRALLIEVREVLELNRRALAQLPDD